jgi:ABC-type antimicrobial peptide transport system permease subunit
MAKKYWPDRDALGGQIRTIGPSVGGNDGLLLEVVGIARTAKYHNLSEEAIPFLYFPMRENFVGGTLLAVTATDAPSFASMVRREWEAMEPNVPLYDVSTMSQSVRHDVLVMERLTAQIMSAVASIGLILSVLGLYAMTAYSVSQRTHEIGIRMALGAAAWQIQRPILARGALLGTAGTAVGIVLVLLLQSILNVFFRPAGNSAAPDPFSPLVYVAVIVLALSVTLLAAYLPARRASRVDPNIALHCDN